MMVRMSLSSIFFIADSVARGYFRIWCWSSLFLPGALILEHSEYSLTLTDLFSLVFQKTCELGTQYMALEKETAQLRVDLDVERRNTAHAQAELKTMGGKL
jgi:hypothetical protein